MNLPGARVSDIHVCPLFSGIVPHIGGPILPPGGVPTFINMLPAARLGDMATCVGPPDAIMAGSISVLIGKKPAARMFDACAHGGLVMWGSLNVLIGGASAGPSGMPISRGADGKIRLGNAVVIEGSPEFQALVINRLSTVATTPAGLTMLSNVDGSGRTMTITEFTGNNSFAGPTSFQNATVAGQPVFDGNGNPINDAAGNQLIGTGTGSDVNVQYNPNLTLPNSADPTNPMPNDGILFHEMEHGSHQMNGTYDGTPVPGWTTQEEQNTISTGSPSEADYLRQRGYPWQRNSHGTTFIPNP